jgi:hypothetical protein
VKNAVNNTLAKFARKALQEVQFRKAQWDAEIAAGRYKLIGPSFVGSVGDGYSQQVPSDRTIREAANAAQVNLINHLDALVRQETGFSGSFLELVDAQRNTGYRPSFYEKGNEAVAVLADAYDYVAGLWGLPEKSYRPEQNGRVKVRRKA